MNTRARLTLLLIASLFGANLVAQAQPRELSVTRTFDLNWISSKDAAQLIGPYAMSGLGAVFEAGSIRAVTVHGPASLIRTADSLLRVFDAPPAMVTLRFKLLAPSDQPGIVPELRDVAQELSEIFGAKGYRMIGEAVARVGERNDYTITMNSETGQVMLMGSVGRVMKGSGQPQINMNISARSVPVMSSSDTTGMQMAGLQQLLGSLEFINTGMTVPIGHTMVLGAGGSADAKSLVLVVTPEL
ncbi:MAG TPA: hypothetical protein PLL69_07705 [Gemmatimonadales bacterium]|nr:hypothetical protein [Gemmatimonadales bacterium]